jgi:hypothetical protein
MLLSNHIIHLNYADNKERKGSVDIVVQTREAPVNETK